MFFNEEEFAMIASYARKMRFDPRFTWGDIAVQMPARPLRTVYVEHAIHPEDAFAAALKEITPHLPAQDIGILRHIRPSNTPSISILDHDSHITNEIPVLLTYLKNFQDLPLLRNIRFAIDHLLHLP